MKKSELSEELLSVYEETLRLEIEKYKNLPDFDEDAFRKQMENIAFDEHPKILVSNELWSYTGIWIDDGVVASGLNIAISLALGGGVTAGIKALVKKVGTKAAVDTILKIIKNKLLWFGIKQISGITPIIQTIVKNLLDPGSTIAKWLDDHDGKPHNGRVDIYD